MFPAVEQSGTLPDLASALSHAIRPMLPHDGYALFGLDPITGTVAFAATRHTYGTQAGYELSLNHVAGLDPNPFAALINGPRPIGIFGTDAPCNEFSARQHEIMAAEGVGSDLSVALTLDGRAWGGMAFVRERRRAPFSLADALCAERLRIPLAAAVKRFVTGQRLAPAHPELAPAVLIVGSDNSIEAMTSTGRTWITGFAPDHARLRENQLTGHLLSVVAAARRAGSEALSRIPTPHGWITLQAQALDGGEPGRLALTIQSAATDLLLPAVIAWYGITSRERAVLDHIMHGEPVKQIARRLNLSQHTVNDHLKAIYRKTGVTGKEELVASLSN